MRQATSVALIAGGLAMQTMFVASPITHAAATISPTWKAMAGLPVAVVGVTAVQLPDSSIVALGGNGVAGMRPRLVARLAPGARAWIHLPDAPINLDTPGALALTSNAVMVVTPAYAAGENAERSKAAILDPQSGAWTMLPDVPLPLMAPRLFRLNTQTVIAFGGVGTTIGAAFDMVRQVWTPVMAPAGPLLSYLPVMVQGIGAILIGSTSLQSGLPQAVRRAWRLTSTGAWTELRRPPVAFDGGQAAELPGERVIFAGGLPVSTDPHAAAPPALFYDARHDRWSVSVLATDRRRGAQLISLLRGRVLLVGGHGPDGSPTDSYALFDGRVWRAERTLPGAWSGFTAVAAGSDSVLLLGGNRTTVSTTGPVSSAVLVNLGS